jgi:hypothetical protein
LYLQPHHLQVIERLKAKFKDDPRYLALLVGGSLVKGWGEVNSDVDIMLIATEEEYERCAASGVFWYYNTEMCDYPGGYVDGKVLNLHFLRDVAQKGSEPARAAFINVFAAFSHLPELDDLLKRIPVYQEAEREEKMLAFYSQVQMFNWFVKEAEQKKSVYLMAHATSGMVFYAARLLLAYNRILYPYHKWLMRAVEGAPDKPENFLELAEKLLKEGSAANARALWECITSFREWNIPYERGVVRFIQDAEWNWRDGRAPLQDW